ncbi:hypothetical protein NQU44_26570, partial [Escherichia coli]|nr:hypothetical protein [Escherichia coli]
RPQLNNPAGQLPAFLPNDPPRIKERARRGEVSAHLIYFIHPQLALARPSEELVDIQKYICSLHMPERYPIKEAVLYT